MIADPLRVTAPTSRMQLLIELARGVTIAPWTLRRDHLERAHAAGLTDDDVLHAVLQSAYFNHLNRIADVVAVPLDYAVQHMPPPVDRAVPAHEVAPHVLAGPFAIEPSRRAASWTALLGWQDYVMARAETRSDGARSHRLPQTRRLVIATQVARLVGDAVELVPPTDALDRLLVQLAREVSLRPWGIVGATLAPLREACLDDAALFDACATASTADTVARVNVALRALAT